MSLSIPPKAVLLQHNYDPNAHAALERKTVYETNSTDTIVNVTLDTNTLYTFTTALSSLAINATAAFQYGGINFFTGGSAPVFSAPATWLFNGDDCTYDNIFIPTFNAYYRLGVEKVGDTVLCDVHKYLTLTPKVD